MSEPDYEAVAFALWVYDSKATAENYGVWNHLTEQSREGYRRMAHAVVNAALHLETPPRDSTSRPQPHDT